MKKRLIYIGAISLFTINCYSQSSNSNYVKTAVYRNTSGLKQESVHYVDGLGRPVLDILKNQSGDGNKDIVTKTEYDACGREWKKWVPTAVANNNGNYVSDIGNISDSKPYSEIEYEPSPLNRANNQWGAGQDWSNHPVRTDYLFNENSGELMCKLYGVNQDGALICNGNYVPGALTVVKMTDEDDRVTYKFTDKLGRVILTRQMDGIQCVDTYYVHDANGDLRYVLPPLAADKLQGNGPHVITDNSVLGLYAYYYRYDNRKNCIEKRFPGFGLRPTYMVYDRSGRLILTQTTMQRSKKLWVVNKYDLLGRLLYTAEIKYANTLDVLVEQFKNQVVVESFTTGTHNHPMGDTGYSCDFFHDVPARLLTVNYYDDYQFLSLPSNTDKSGLGYTAQPGYGEKYDNNKGLLTGTRVYNLNTPSLYETTVCYYDKKGNMLQERSTNHLDGYDITYNKYDFVGNVLESYKTHTTTMYDNISSEEKYRYTYDHAGRLLNTFYKYGNETEITLSENVYDELGRLSIKYRHNRQDTISYEYNIRDWITEIKNGTFEEQLYYNSNPINSDPCYNGNISAAVWRYNNEYNGYQFIYDPLNRLVSAYSYKEKDMSDHDNGYEEQIEYDKNGNITFLFRNTPLYGNMDRLITRYSGNQLISVFDEEGSQNRYDVKEYHDLSEDRNFYYDNNGNMTADLDRDIVTIKYNLLNLPDTIQFKNGSQILNTYMADGRKIRTDYITYKGIYDVEVSLGGIFEWNFYQDIIVWYADIYSDNCIYRFNREHDGTFLALLQMNNPEGYTTSNWSGASNFYFRKDHLGSIRELWRAQDKKVMQCMQYYPTGLPWVDCESNTEQRNKCKYNGKEYIEDHGYDTYDYIARAYLPTIGRFTTIDPLCEKHYSVSPYSYCGGNPMNRFDPDGRDWIYVAETGKYEWDNKVLSPNDVSENGAIYVGRHMTDILTFAGVSMPSDAIVNTQSKTFTGSDGIDREVDIYEIDGNYWGDVAFQFLSDNTKVEWGLFSFGNTMLNVDGNSFLTTTKKASSESGSYFLGDMLKKNSSAMNTKIIQKHAHNHPGGTPGPSGADMEFAIAMSSMFPNMSFMIYTRQHGYNQYDQYGVNLLPEITIIGNKK